MEMGRGSAAHCFKGVFMKKNELSIGKQSLIAVLIFAVMLTFSIPMSVFADNVHGIPAYQKKDYFSKEKKSFDLPVTDVSDEAAEQPAKDGITFEILNTTTQMAEGTATTKNGKLSGLNLTEDHNYTLICEDSQYGMDNNVYIWVHNGELLNIKRTKEMGTDGIMQDQGPFDYLSIDSLHVHKLEAPASSADINRVRVSLPVTEAGTSKALSNIHFDFISDTETKSAVSDGNGNVSVRLLEDKDYMVQVKDSVYGIVTFPLSVKDKSEYRAKKYPYNHTNCKQVKTLELYKKSSGEPMLTNPALTSESKNTTLRGIDFGDMELVDRKLSTTVDSLKDKTYDVIGIYAINTHRYEISRMAAGNFTVTEILPENKTVKNVYALDGQKLTPLTFKQSGNTVDISMHSVSMYPIVIEYGENGTEQTLNKNALNVKVVNQNNKPIKGVPLTLRYRSSDNPQSNVDIGTTDSQGRLTYIPNDSEVLSSDPYSVSPTDLKTYSCDKPIIVTFEENDEGLLVPYSVGKGNDAKDYTGEITVQITAPDPAEEKPDPQPSEEMQKNLKLKVVNQYGDPVQGVKLNISSGNASIASLPETDAEGKTSYTCDENVLPQMDYELALIKGQRYTMDSTISLYIDGDDDDPYISTINGTDYDGSEFIVTINDPQAKDPDADQTRDLRFKVVDDKGNPVSGAKFILKSGKYPGFGDQKIKAASNKEGMITYTCTSKESAEDVYTIESADSAKYELQGAPIRVSFDYNDRTNEPYIKNVGGKSYTKDSAPIQVTVRVKESKPTNTGGNSGSGSTYVNPGTVPSAPITLAKMVITKNVYPYDGQNIVPKIIIMDANNDIVDPALYEIFGASKSVGRHMITVKLKNGSGNILSADYVIRPAAVKGFSVKAGKKSAKAVWKSHKAQTSGFQIQYGTSKNLKHKKTITVRKASAVQKTIQSLKSKKAYFFRIRAYKTIASDSVSDTTYYSAWSMVKNVTVK